MASNDTYVEVSVQKIADLVADYIKVREFARWIVSLDDDDPDSPGRKDRQTVNLTKIINRAKEALGE